MSLKDNLGGISISTNKNHYLKPKVFSLHVDYKSDNNVSTLLPLLELRKDPYKYLTHYVEQGVGVIIHKCPSFNHTRYHLGDRCLEIEVEIS